MSGSKRTFDIGDKSSSKRVRFDSSSKRKNQERDFDYEFNHEDELEERKSRRGKVNFDVYGSDDEEVGGGAYSSDSDKEDEKEEEEQEKVPQNEDFDMFGDAPADDPKGKKPAGREKKEDLRQVKGEELDSFDRSDDEDDIENGVRKEGKISAFNMKQEMEEGSIDANGNFIRNKVDPQAFHDKWMEGITRKDINKAKEAHDKRERDEAVKEAQRQAELPQTKTDIYRALVEYLQPRQNVQEALTSLSNSLPKKLPAWKQKMLDKKNKRTKQQPTKQQALSEEEEAERRRKVDMITALADQMMALGDFDIYEESFEVMVQHLRSEGVVPQDWLPASVNK